jgi:PIN domain nuclease of toxin-antitoxin system
VEKGKVRLLLDTNALIWAFSDPQRLSGYARETISDEENDVLVSVVSVWEIGVKRAKRKLDMPGDLEAMLAAKRFDPLPLTFRHALTVESLPDEHHDPFDRMLIAQAQVDGLTMVTSDRAMRRYPISVLSAI